MSDCRHGNNRNECAFCDLISAVDDNCQLTMERDWAESHHKAISKGCGSSWDIQQMREVISKAEDAIESAGGGVWVMFSFLSCLRFALSQLEFG